VRSLYFLLAILQLPLSLLPWGFSIVRRRIFLKLADHAPVVAQLDLIQ
jgi:hypothetical protein